MRERKVQERFPRLPHPSFWGVLVGVEDEREKEKKGAIVAVVVVVGSTSKLHPRAFRIRSVLLFCTFLSLSLSFASALSCVSRLLHHRERVHAARRGKRRRKRARKKKHEAERRHHQHQR